MLTFESNNHELNYAFKIAVGDIFTNIAPYWTTLGERRYDPERDLIDAESEVLNAGLDYPTPWTRDAAINTWNGVGFFRPDITKNTLLSALDKQEDKIILKDQYDSQYWDAIIWSIGAWEQFLYTGDQDFLKIAFEAVLNAMTFFEETEFDEERGLFRGPASTSDGISGYPDFYADTKSSEMHGGAFILDWLESHPDERVKTGRGMPMFALSTNCLYYRAYRIIEEMSKVAGKASFCQWSQKGDKLKEAINTHFWSDKLGHYKYLVDDFRDCESQECMGHGYALMFGIADGEKASQIIQNQKSFAAGLPVLWPLFDRHKDGTGNSFGRHCGCVWPPFEAMFTLGAKMFGRNDFFLNQLDNLTRYVCRDLHFSEIYHPLTGQRYGGVQKFKEDPFCVWKSCPRQTWSATCFLRLILRGLAGIELGVEGMVFSPVLAESISQITLRGLSYQDMTLDIKIQGSGKTINEFKIDGQEQSDPFLPLDKKGCVKIEIALS
jgi:glycogen debranching enzyme